MKHPPYHLRANKAVDRFLLIELIDALDDALRLSETSYHGLGGPFLEDMRLMCHYYPKMRLFSIEGDKDTYRRQLFHQNTKKLDIRHEDLDSYLRQFESGQPCVFWLDFTGRKSSHLAQFMQVVEAVGPPSVVKVTIDANPNLDNRTLAYLSNLGLDGAENARERDAEQFQLEFDDYLQHPVGVNDLTREGLPRLLQSMFQKAASKALPPNSDRRFRILHSCRYEDGAQMLSLCGVVCDDTDYGRVTKALSGWPRANLDWSPPDQIDVPDLSLKERLELERSLPVKNGTGKGLKRILGYKIDHTGASTVRKMKQYEDFYRYYPLFARLNL